VVYPCFIQLADAVPGTVDTSWARFDANLRITGGAATLRTLAGSSRTFLPRASGHLTSHARLNRHHDGQPVTGGLVGHDPSPGPPRTDGLMRNRASLSPPRTSGTIEVAQNDADAVRA
jgi:hypothetical protein